MCSIRKDRRISVSRLFDTIRETPWLVWQLLTKRPKAMLKMLPADFGPDLYPNVWLGITTEDQDSYDARWPILAGVDAVVRFLSYEPALGPLELWHAADSLGMPSLPDWVIAGGESGPGARPFEADWGACVAGPVPRLGGGVLFQAVGPVRKQPADGRVGPSARDEDGPEGERQRRRAARRSSVP